jgi:hypothetical protein
MHNSLAINLFYDAFISFPQTAAQPPLIPQSNGVARQIPKVLYYVSTFFSIVLFMLSFSDCYKTCKI